MNSSIISVKFWETITKYDLVQHGDTVIVGISGGADSISLLNLLNGIKEKYNLKLIAVHVHHGLRGNEADRDMEFCKEMCENLEIEMKVHLFDVQEESKKRKLTVEETGREVRYEVFFDVLNSEGGTKIAVAHNQNDQAETVLMRLFRGTGIKGLSGIKVKRECIIRPLLFVSRREIEEYCEREGIAYRVDKTNYEIEYTRNYIRHDIIPRIQECCNESIIQTLSRTAAIMSEEEQFLHSMTQEALCKISKIENDKTYVSIDDFKVYDIVLQKRMLREICHRYNKTNITSTHIESIISLLEKSSGKMINLPQNLKVLMEFKNLCIYKQTENYSKYCYNLVLNEEIFIKEEGIYLFASPQPVEDKGTCKGVFNYDIIQNGVHVRNRKEGDRINGNKKLKDWFIEKKFSYDERERQMLLTDGQNILWIVGELFSDSYKVSSNTKNKLYVYIRNTNEDIRRIQDEPN